MNCLPYWKISKTSGLRGTTLVEVIIALVLFGTVITLVGTIATSAFRYSARSASGNECLRSAALVSEELSRELRFCEAVVWPQYSRWDRGYKLTSATGKDLLIVCRMRSAKNNGKMLVGYRYLGQGGSLERCIYEGTQDFDNSMVSSDRGIVAKKTLLTGVTEVSFWSVEQAQCYGKHMLGIGFSVVPLEREAKIPPSEAKQGLPFIAQVQVKGV